MKQIPIYLQLGAGLACVAPVLAAEAPNLEQRLQKVEGLLEHVLKENAELKKELGYSTNTPLVLVKPKGKVASVNLGGYIQGHAEFGDAPDPRFAGIEDRFLLRRARLNVQGTFAEHFDYTLMADFGNNSISGKTGYSAQLADAFINWNRYDFANVKFGQFKTPFGYEQLLADTKILTVERSLPNDMLTLSRQIGLGVSGDLYDQRLGYSAGIFNGNGANNGFNDNGDFLYVARLNGTAYKGKWGKQNVSVNAGVNGYYSEDNALKIPGFGFDSTPGGTADNLFTGCRAGWAADLQFKLGPFALYGEYFQSRFDQAANATVDAAGWYTMATFDVLPKRLQAVGRFESFDPNTDAGGNRHEVWTAGLNYFIKGDDIKLSANYLFGDPPGGSSEFEGRFLTRVQIAF